MNNGQGSIRGIIKRIFDEKYVSEKFNTRDFVITIDGQYPQHIQVQLVNQRCDLIIGLRPGDEVEVQYIIKGREWNSPDGIKYFNTVEVWKLDVIAKGR